MADSGEPSKKTRRKFLKEIGTGIIGVYATTTSIKAKTSDLKKEILEKVESKIDLVLKVNGKNVRKSIVPNKTLAEFLREDLNLTGTKLVCNHGECGSCTVLLDNKPIYSCHFLAIDAVGKDILTIEGLLEGDELNSIQKSFVNEDGLQCGFCTPGQIMSGYAIMLHNPNATDTEIKEGLSGNLCRCAAYPKIFDSVKSALNK